MMISALALRPLLITFFIPPIYAYHAEQASLHNHEHLNEWTGCLPGPLQYPNHPTCPLPPDFNENVTDEPAEDAAEFAPWTHRPYCALPDTAMNQTTSYCVFTKAAYPSANQGISVIANPDDPAAESSLSFLGALFLKHPSPLSSSESPTPSRTTKEAEGPYKITPLPGRGLGLIATRKIGKGEVLMVDYAALIAEMAFPGRVTREVGRGLFERGIRRLGEERRDEVLGLAVSGPAGASGEMGKDEREKQVDVEDVVKTNSFTVSVGGSSYMALFSKIARINHACNPSAFTRFDEKTLSNKVMAFRDINKGEEITISYSEFGLTHAERQKVLELKWGFKCTCSLCTAPQSDITASDARRLKIKALGPQVIQQVQDSNFRLAIELNKEMVDLLQKEKMIPHMGEQHEAMARLNMAAGNRKEAKKYAKLAIGDLEKYAIGWGDESEKSVRELKELMQKI